MEKKLAAFVILGLMIGALFGSGLGSANGNTLLGLGFGALAGVFLGWFIAAAVLENEKNRKAGK